MPAPIVHPTRVVLLLADPATGVSVNTLVPCAPVMFVPATVLVVVISPNARPPVTYTSSVGVTVGPIRPRTAPNQFSFLLMSLVTGKAATLNGVVSPMCQAEQVLLRGATDVSAPPASGALAEANWNTL